METLNVVSTPNITGNVGSCTTQTARVVSQRLSFWTQDITTLATNSCTGEVTRFDSWEVTGPGFLLFMGLFLLFLLVLKIVSSFISTWFD